MPWSRTCLALSVAIFAIPMDVATAYEPPSASLLPEIRRHHATRDWWIVTTDSARYVVQVGVIGDAALTRLRPGHGTKSAPDPLPWSSIARVDLRKSKFLSRRIVGLPLGGIVGGIMPVVFGAQGTYWTPIGISAGAAAGGWLGGLHGDRLTREQTLYVSPSLFGPHPGIAVAPADTSAPVSSETSADTLRVATAPRTTPAIRVACRQIDDDDLLRIRADFGTFEGFASRADSTGLSGLRAWSAPGVEAFPAQISWDRVRTVEIRGNRVGQAAIRGAVGLGVLGAVGGLLAIWGATTYGNDSANPGVNWVLEPAAIGAIGGFVIGGVTGSTRAVWRRVYP